MTYFRETSGTNNTGAMAPVDFTSSEQISQQDYATSVKQAKLCQEYNRMVYDCIEKYKDLNSIMTYKRNLEDKTKYKQNGS